MFQNILLLALLALVLTCCPPKQWRGTVYIDSNTKTADGQEYHTQMSQDTVVDEIIRKVYVNQTISLNGGPEYLQQVYQDFTTGLQYVIKGGACFTMNVSSSEPSCIPKNAEVVSKSFIGSGKTALKATMYHFTRDNLDVHLTMTDDGCIPVMVEGNGVTQTGEDMKMAAEYMGIVVAPMNVSIFDIPSICMK
ncbi:ependymin-related protein 2-like [Mytilus trossulus]|uniref:ependymin-related protein 2-like n=1 Tax=Mytilus trossulus TaxID=6551 RepID=UPI0030057BF9